MEGDVIVMQDVFVFEQTGVVEGKIQGRLKPTGIRPKFVEKFEVHGDPPAARPLRLRRTRRARRARRGHADHRRRRRRRARDPPDRRRDLLVGRRDGHQRTRLERYASGRGGEAEDRVDRAGPARRPHRPERGDRPAEQGRRAARLRRQPRPRPRARRPEAEGRASTSSSGSAPIVGVPVLMSTRSASPSRPCRTRSLLLVGAVIGFFLPALLRPAAPGRAAQPRSTSSSRTRSRSSRTRCGPARRSSRRSSWSSASRARRSRRSSSG